jgi:hypothetical protein
MKKAAVAFGCLVLLLTIPVHAAEEDCANLAETYRTDSLSRLFRLEKYYVTAAWHYRKSQETVYNPLWEANLRQKDRFSRDRRAEGEVIFRRYRAEADRLTSTADRNARKTLREFEKLEKVWTAGIYCGSLGPDPGLKPSQTAFDTCMSLWKNDWDQGVIELKRVLKEFQLWEGKISLAAEKTLNETPSDHAKFTDRFRDYFSEIDLRIYADFQAVTRKLRELLELRWPAGDCCRVCGGDKTAEVDPVFGLVKLDPIGSRGVDDQTYKKSSLLEAFKTMNEEEIPEKEPGI